MSFMLIVKLLDALHLVHMFTHIQSRHLSKAAYSSESKPTICTQCVSLSPPAPQTVD